MKRSTKANTNTTTKRLALCADIAAAFGAKLEFTSTVGEGTTVALTLPKEVYAHEEADD